METNTDKRRENVPYESPENIENSLKVNAKKQHNMSTRKVNRLWLWLGVLVLVLILLYWVFFIAIGFGPNQ